MRRQPIAIRDVARLNIKPGEVLIVTLPTGTPQEDQERTLAKVQEKLPGVKVIIKAESVGMWILGSDDLLHGPRTEYNIDQWNATTTEP